MMFSNSPRLVKGAIIGVDPSNPLASVIFFQYNPETLTRTLQAQTVGNESGDRTESLRFKGPPVETIKLSVKIDAIDQLERAETNAVSMGIYPQLSALEMLLYPKSATVIANMASLALGKMEIIAPQAPLTLFVWGPKRVLPVRLTDFNITEEAHDANLNPIRAEVSLTLRVLSYNDLPASNIGYGLFLAHQIAKEAMATMGSLGNLAEAGGGKVNLA